MTRTWVALVHYSTIVKKKLTTNIVTVLPLNHPSKDVLPTYPGKHSLTMTENINIFNDVQIGPTPEFPS